MHLPPGLTVAESLRSCWVIWPTSFPHNAPLAAAGRDGLEPVHEMRVAVRRLRLPSPCSARRSVVWRWTSLRPASRRWPIALGRRATGMCSSPRPPPLSARRCRTTPVCGGCARRPSGGGVAHAALRDWLGGVEFRRLGLALAGLAGAALAWQVALDLEQAETLGLSLEAFASRALARRLHRLAAAGEAIGAPRHEDVACDPAARQAHALRGGAGPAPLYPGKVVAAGAAAGAAAGPAAGRLNDSLVGDALLAEMGAGTGGGGTRRLGARLSGGRQLRCARADRRAWARFHRLEPFWG